MLRFDCVEHRLIKRIERLVAAPSRARVENRVLRFAVRVRVTRVDYAEIGEQRNQLAVSLVNAAANFMNFVDFVPRVYVVFIFRFRFCPAERMR